MVALYRENILMFVNFAKNILNYIKPIVLFPKSAKSGLQTCQNRAQKCIFKNMVSWTNLQLKFRLSKNCILPICEYSLSIQT